MKIDLSVLKNKLWSLYYEEYPNGKLTDDEARLIYDSMVVVNYALKNNYCIDMTDLLNRP
ncbi:hypothetical protein [Paenibacillus sp. FSL E2-0178]|uniref:hypothetical protein n=1 Tax=Paenibacillus sp. FSL E2-0178 TaxID=2921361 RepID=UPI00315828EA